jgi:pimeloyl-ACP methyl ester carboxylesterase
MWRLAVSLEAELEIFEAALRSERERADLGFRFEAQVNTVFVRLVDNPFLFPEIEEGARRALVRDFPYGVFFDIDAVSPEQAAARITVPVLLVHGAADVDTRPEHSQRVFRALHGPKRLILVPGARHNASLRPDVWATVEDWIDQVVPQSH